MHYVSIGPYISWAPDRKWWNKIPLSHYFKQAANTYSFQSVPMFLKSNSQKTSPNSLQQSWSASLCVTVERWTLLDADWKKSSNAFQANWALKSSGQAFIVHTCVLRALAQN